MEVNDAFKVRARAPVSGYYYRSYADVGQPKSSETMMRKLKSQATDGLWSTDWWEIAVDVTAIVRTSSDGGCSVRVKAGSESPLHVVDSSVPAHWQKSQSTDITKAVASGRAHNLTHLLKNGGVAMQRDGVDDWVLQVEKEAVEGTLRSIVENYATQT